MCCNCLTCLLYPTGIFEFVNTICPKYLKCVTIQISHTFKKEGNHEKNHYTAAEVIKKLNIPRSSFYHLMKIGEIPEGIIVPLRKQALYPKKEIDKLVEERARVLAEYEQTPERLKFMLPNREDLVQLVDLDRLVFHEETLIQPEEQIARFAYNPEAIHVLKDTKTDTVLGGITLSPLKQNILEKLIRLEIDETQVKPEDYLPFEPEKQRIAMLSVSLLDPASLRTVLRWKATLRSLRLFGRVTRKRCGHQTYLYSSHNRRWRPLSAKTTIQAFTGRVAGPFEDFRHPYVLDLKPKKTDQSLLVSIYRRRKTLRDAGRGTRDNPERIQKKNKWPDMKQINQITGQNSKVKVS